MSAFPDRLRRAAAWFWVVLVGLCVVAGGVLGAVGLWMSGDYVQRRILVGFLAVWITGYVLWWSLEVKRQ